MVMLSKFLDICVFRIYREDNGIPHIHGKSLKDVYYGLGFVHAQDRLW